MTPTEFGDITADISHGAMSMWLDAEVTEGQARGYLQVQT